VAPRFWCGSLHIDPRRRSTLSWVRGRRRAEGGSDFDLDRLVALRRRDLTDAPFINGRLVITPLGDGAFRFERTWRSTK